MKKILFWVIAAGLLGWGTVYAFSGVTKKQNFVTQSITRGSITDSVTASGIIKPISNIQVGTQVSGTILRLYVDYNSEVKQGDLLAQIDPALFESDVEKSKANLEVTKAQLLVSTASRDFFKKNLDRIKTLNKNKYSSDKELDQAQKDYDTAVANVILNQAQVQQAKAALDYFTTQLNYTRIVSPVNGMIVSRAVEEGQTVAASFNTPTLFVVAEDLTKMKIEASVVEADISKIQEGQEVNFNVDSFPEDTFKGIVTQVRNEAINNANVVTYVVIIEIDNSDLKFKPGMTANVEIITEKKDDVFVVPSKALRFSLDGGKTRYRDRGIWILENGKPRRITVKTGIYNDDRTEILEGDLKEGQQIIIELARDNKTTSRPVIRMPR